MEQKHGKSGNSCRIGLVAALLALGCGNESATSPEPSPPRPVYVLSYDEFVTRVAPVLSGNGCDNSLCHGGSSTLAFRLSPRDQKDMHVDFREACRQVAPSDPAGSPLVMKPLAEECGGDTHGGGAYFYSFEDPGYVAILTWIENGEYR
jgi:hypothetical protein